MADDDSVQKIMDPDRSSFDLLFGLTGPRYQTWPERAGRSVMGDIYSLMHPPQDTQQQISEGAVPAFRTAASLTTAGYPGAEGGAAGIFGGRLAKTANLENLRAAEQLSQMGVDKDVIWRTLGWAKGKDGKWRFEIPDKNAHLWSGVKDTLQTGKGAMLKPGVFSHPDLYEAYPQLRNVAVLPMKEGSNYLGQQYGMDIRLAQRPRPQMQSTLLHEIQHVVQDIEDFGRGSNPGMFTEPDPKIAKITKTLDLIRERQSLLSRNKGYETNQAELSALAEAWDKLFRLKTKIANRQNPYEMYRKTSGEVESRNVQAREKYDEEKRYEISPEMSQDIPYNKQFVVKR